MKPHTLEEFAEQLLISGDSREADFAVEILALIPLEEEMSEAHAKELNELEGKLAEIEKLLDYPDDLAERILELRDLVSDAERILETSGWSEGDFLDGLQELVDRAPPKLEYDL